MVQAILSLISTTVLGLFQDSFILTPFLSQPSPIISTTSGSYVGTVNHNAGVEVFLGIRYAEPPVGQLRFAAPVPVTNPPIERQDGTKFGNACAQQVRNVCFTRSKEFNLKLTSSIASLRRFYPSIW